MSLGPRSAPRAMADELRAHVAALLRASEVHDAVAAREAVIERAARQLVPDEARILHHLGQHGPSPLLDVHCLTRTGVPGDAVVQNASLVGRAAGVALPQLTPYYVAHLLSLHLVEVGAEDERLIDGYQALLVEPTVLAAMARAGNAAVTPRTVRRTLRLSTLGRELWVTAFPSDPHA